MKQLYLFSVFFFLCFGAQAQDPNLIGQWYLYEIRLELDPTIYIDGWSPYGDPDYPQIYPDLIVAEDFSFTGTGVCNTFQGDWVHQGNDDFISISYSDTGLGCGLYEDELEGHYMTLFHEDVYVLTGVNDLGNGLFEMLIGGGPFTGLYFLSEPILGLHEVEELGFVLGPNPGQGLIEVRSDEPWDELSVYNLSGQLLSRHTEVVDRIDLSNLADGLYFIELYAGDARAVQKWLKQ